MQYKVTNFDREGSKKSSGKDLMKNGLTVELKEKPGAAVVVYKKDGLNRSLTLGLERIEVAKSMISVQQTAGADLSTRAAAGLGKPQQ